MMSSSVITQRVAKLRFSPPQSSAGASQVEGIVRNLHLNESPLPPSPAVVAAMQDAAIGLNRYPDHDGAALIKALSRGMGVDPRRLIIGSGSNELLYASTEISLDPEREGLVPDPGFPSYIKAIELRGARAVPVPTKEDGVVDVESTLNAVTPRTRLAFVTSPQNPTGGIMSTDEVAHLARELPDHVLLHFDEAYYEFGRHAGAPDALPLLAARTGPWIATRTFSKAFGLAGARLGYGICSTAGLADAYRKIRINFSVNAVVLAGATVALEEEDHLNMLLDRNAEQRKRLTGGLEKLGLVVLPSAANFVSTLIPIDAEAVAARLRQQGIFVLPFRWRDSSGALRITLADDADSDAVIAALERILAKT